MVTSFFSFNNALQQTVFPGMSSCKYQPGICPYFNAECITRSDKQGPVEVLQFKQRRPLQRDAQNHLFGIFLLVDAVPLEARSEEHTSELQSLMRISYAVFCLKKKH